MIATSAVAGALRPDSFPPVALHPENPHYFLFRGRPTVLVTSGEHYGAVLNPDFNYVRYLDTLKAHGFNLTRTFSGAYVEAADVLNIPGNVLAPAPGRFLAPWARSREPGNALGGNKFDLTRFNDDYFKRLRDFMSYASQCGIVVEFNFFCRSYGEHFWRISPMNAANNINGLGWIGRNDALTMSRHDGLLAIEEVLVRRIVAELRNFDNLYYEVCNEPYHPTITPNWQRHMAEVIASAERDHPHRHLISQNVKNGSMKIHRPHPAISIFNFHYATPPAAVTQNYSLGKAIGDNETGAKGIGDRHYRMEGWEFLLAGGGLYNNLDFSFTVGHGDGSFINPPEQVGGGSPALRKQLEILKRFVESFDFIRMRPDPAVIRGGVPKGARVQVLAEPGKAYALYLTEGPRADLELRIPTGRYRAEWLNPLTGRIDKAEEIDHRKGKARLASPEFPEDMALRLRRI